MYAVTDTSWRGMWPQVPFAAAADNTGKYINNVMSVLAVIHLALLTAVLWTSNAASDCVAGDDSFVKWSTR